LTQFRRSATVSVGLPGGLIGVSLTGFKIVFDITKNLEKTPNTGKVQVYNLSESTRNKLDLALPKNKEPPQKLFINAGYLEGDGEEVLFIGDITEISHIKDIPNIVTTIEA